MNKIPDICFLLFAICYGLHWGGIQTFRHPRFQKPQKVSFSHNVNGVYFYSVLCVGPLASLLSTPKNVFYMRVLDNCDFSPVKWTWLALQRAFRLTSNTPCLWLMISYQVHKIWKPKQGMCWVLSPLGASHTVTWHWVWSLNKHIITQLVIVKMWRYHILPIQIL